MELTVNCGPDFPVLADPPENELDELEVCGAARRAAGSRLVTHCLDVRGRRPNQCPCNQRACENNVVGVPIADQPQYEAVAALRWWRGLRLRHRWREISRLLLYYQTSSIYHVS